MVAYSWEDAWDETDLAIPRELQRDGPASHTPLPGVARIYTSLVLTEVKSTTAIPLS